MDSTSVKAITFKFLPLTKIKLDRLKKMSNEFKRVYNFASDRLPSFQELGQAKSRTLMGVIRKDIESTLHSQITQEAIEYARANYCTILQNEDNGVPHINANIIRLHNQIWKFQIKDNRYYLVIPAERNGSKYNKLWLPVKTNKYLENLIKTTKFGVGQINLKNQTFTTSFKVEIKTLDYLPETRIGIDLGLNNLAVMIVLDSSNQVLQTKFWSGREVMHIRMQFHKYRKAVQEMGRIDCNKKSKGYEHNWMKNINHNISREIIDTAKKYPNPVVIMENLHRFKKGKIQWNFYQLRNMIGYKAELEGIVLKLVNPKETSQMCNKCGYISIDNRSGVLFRCEKCGYSVHADFNAAVNIAKLT